jgi:hypothetical protein
MKSILPTMAPNSCVISMQTDDFRNLVIVDSFDCWANGPKQHSPGQSEAAKPQSAALGNRPALIEQFKRYLKEYTHGRLNHLSYSVLNEETGLRIRLLLGSQPKQGWTKVIKDGQTDYVLPNWIDFKIKAQS